MGPSHRLASSIGIRLRPASLATCSSAIFLTPKYHAAGWDKYGPHTPEPSVVEIELSCGHRLRIVGAYDPDAVARLVRSLSA